MTVSPASAGGVDCDTAWTKSATEALADLRVDPLLGLKTGEVESRRRQFGENQLKAAKRRNVLSILADEFKSAESSASVSAPHSVISPQSAQKK